jgi:hypothetical protein
MHFELIIYFKFNDLVELLKSQLDKIYNIIDIGYVPNTMSSVFAHNKIDFLVYLL